MSTVHIFPIDKFVPDFISFVNEKFPEGEQIFITYGCKKNYNLPEANNHIHFNKYNIIFYMYALIKMKISDKVVLHSLLNINIVILLFFNRSILNKSYWVIWGDEIYQHDRFDNLYWRVREKIKRVVFSRIPFLVTTTRGDVALTKRLYNSKAKQIDCFTYPSNLYKGNFCSSPAHDDNHITVIQIGNSSNPTNEHEVVFDLINKSNLTEYRLFCPVAYGNKINCDNLVKLGNEMFGDKIKFQRNLVSLKEYNTTLMGVNIGIFAQRRQQAAGNIITLLGMGKTIYMDTRSPLYEYFKSLGLIIHDYSTGDYKEQDSSISIHNSRVIESRFSKDSLKEDLEEWIL